ncbi:methionine ABC transporter substrate-binding protein [Insulibacter thermoxylanivorax]|uniref:Lipoprotein n=1 Tax=Insulibacter thermoxylanivorax TaxID=2749268 RepID=A0A916QB56_9BACL|nr:MetQ/NlpA family ABC transporter substrate-binding protein [Insulibacter thermoxylanivorax]GFR37511.1 methionine ABC transporter substrate-binding protein [Insulibacter thermoxylanivorax]
MKKWLLVLAAVLLIFVAGCAQDNGGNTGNNAAQNQNAETNNEAENGANEQSEQPAQVEEVTLNIGASEIPHSEILNFVAPILAEQGVNLNIVVFNDYVQPNVQLYEGELDANFVQHQPYLDEFNAERGYDLVSAGGIHIEPFGVYSNRVQSLDELEEGAKIAIPNDPTNRGRALLLLAQNGLIELSEEAGTSATPADITNNPHNFEFVELEAAMLPRMLDEFDAAAINTNYALQADLNPLEDALVIEDAESPYVNIVAVRPDNQDSEAIKKLVAVLQSQEVEEFILENYNGAVVPAFQ